MKKIRAQNDELSSLIKIWEEKLLNIEQALLCSKRNQQNRTIKQIIGHMIDSASNNIHRVVHLQYQPTPLHFPDYAYMGNNDRWISIQNYQNEDWETLVKLWKYIHLHAIHVFAKADVSKYDNEWISGSEERVSLKNMIYNFLPHFQLHIKEVEELMTH